MGPTASSTKWAWHLLLVTLCGLHVQKYAVVPNVFASPLYVTTSFIGLYVQLQTTCLALGTTVMLLLALQSCVQPVELAVFTDNFRQANRVDRNGAIVSYQLTACAYEDDTWMLKVEQENFDVQFPT